MPTLKNRMIFISHAWQYSQHYWKMVEWLSGLIMSLIFHGVIAVFQVMIPYQTKHQLG